MSLAGEEGLKAEHAPDRPVHTWPLDTARKEPRGFADTPTYRLQTHPLTEGEHFMT